MKCCVRKARFSMCRQHAEMTHHYSTEGTARGFLCDERKTCFILCLSDPQNASYLDGKHSDAGKYEFSTHGKNWPLTRMEIL